MTFGRLGFSLSGATGIIFWLSELPDVLRFPLENLILRFPQVEDMKIFSEELALSSHELCVAQQHIVYKSFRTT